MNVLASGYKITIKRERERGLENEQKRRLHYCNTASFAAFLYGHLSSLTAFSAWLIGPRSFRLKEDLFCLLFFGQYGIKGGTEPTDGLFGLISLLDFFNRMRRRSRSIKTIDISYPPQISPHAIWSWDISTHSKRRGREKRGDAHR